MYPEPRTNGKEEGVEKDEARVDAPQFWLYASRIILVCQWCDTSIFESGEDADFADLERSKQGHACGREGDGHAG